ncbi:hypothetical protein TWF730_003809 [Orbilia blumenaviensis]|uniref:Uncharacterized protein n=1 Tax=Orbilia blumenaviensis TaxID=1796055 RepID=A0AAV9U173_9PEZI
MIRAFIVGRAALTIALFVEGSRPQSMGTLSTTTVWSTVRSTSTLTVNTCPCLSLPFCNAIQWPTSTSQISSDFLLPSTNPVTTVTQLAITSTNTGTTLQPSQTIAPGQEFKIGVFIPGSDFFLRIGVNIGLVDLVDPTGNEQTYFVDADGYIHYAADPSQILYFPPFSATGFRQLRDQQSLIAIFKYEDADLLTDYDIANEFEVFVDGLRLISNGTILNFYVAFRNETSTTGLMRRQSSVRGLYIVEDESNLPPGFQRASMTPIIPQPSSSPVPSTITKSQLVSTRSASSSSLSKATSSVSVSASESSSGTSISPSSSSSSIGGADAYSIIMSQSLFPFCSSLLDYSSETTLVVPGREIILTSRVDFTTTEVSAGITVSITSSTTTTTTLFYNFSTSSDTVKRKRYIETPLPLTEFPAMTLTSACSKAISSPTFTSTSTSSLPPTKTVTTTSSNPITTEVSVSYETTTTTAVDVSVSVIEANIATGYLAIPPADAGAEPTAWLRCTENSGSKPYGTGKYLIYERESSDCKDLFTDKKTMIAGFSGGVQLNVAQEATDAANSGRDFLLCVADAQLTGLTRPWFYTVNYRSSGTIADLVLDPAGNPGGETLFAWCVYPSYTNSAGITVDADSYLSLAPNNNSKPDEATSCTYYDHLYFSAFIT